MADTFRHAAVRALRWSVQLCWPSRSASRPKPPDPEILNRIDAAITNLPELTREVFIMHRFEDLSYDRIAHRLGIDVDEVQRQMALAIGQIHREVEEMLSSASDGP